MNNLLLLVILGIVGFVFLSISASQIQDSYFYFKNISTDNDVYHSSDSMNLSIVIYSNSDLENVTVMANGINKRFNTERNLNLNKGINEVSFAYTLPRCNVCGGIKPGDYNLTCTISYKNTTIEDSTIINIQQ